MHSGIKSGKRAIVFMKDGTKIIDTFVERSRTHAIFKTQRISYRDIRTIGIYKSNGS